MFEKKIWSACSSFGFQFLEQTGRIALESNHSKKERKLLQEYPQDSTKESNVPEDSCNSSPFGAVRILHSSPIGQ